jgi:hypothetical protein
MGDAHFRHFTFSSIGLRFSPFSPAHFPAMRRSRYSNGFSFSRHIANVHLLPINR